MYYKKNNKTKYYKLLLIIVIIIILILFLNKKQFNNNNFFKTTKNMSINIVSYFTKPFITISDNFKDTKSLKKENKELNKNINHYILTEQKNEQLEKEILELKELLELKTLYSLYELENSTIIIRNKDYFFNTITIDKGESSNIKIDNPVVTKNGLIGKVISTTKNTSTIKLITSTSTADFYSTVEY